VVVLLPAATHAFPSDKVIGIKIKDGLPIEQCVINEAQLLEQTRQIAAGTDVPRGNSEQLL
jgi:hypothetical protein